MARVWSMPCCGAGHERRRPWWPHCRTARPAEAALKYSYPEWIAAGWWEQWGPQEARALMAAGNNAPEAAVRANTLKTTRDELAAALPVASRPAESLPEGLVLEAPFDVHGSQLWEEGRLMPQSRAAQAVGAHRRPAAG